MSEKGGLGSSGAGSGPRRPRHSGDGCHFLVLPTHSDPAQEELGERESPTVVQGVPLPRQRQGGHR